MVDGYVVVKNFNEEKNKNELWLQGTVVSNPRLDHSILSKDFYLFQMNVERDGGKGSDILPVYCDEELLQYVKKGEKLSLIGKIVTRFDEADGKRKHIVKVKMKQLADFNGVADDINHFEFEGYMKEKFAIRDVSNGKHKIIDFKIVSKYNENKNIFSCNAWDNVINEIVKIPDGAFVNGVGRLQKRDFVRLNKETGKQENHTIYEVCVNQIKCK